MTDEQRDLEELVKSPGWLRFLKYARKSWVTEYPNRVKAAILKAQAEKTDIGAAVQCIDYAQDQINALASYPEERVKQLLELEQKQDQMWKQTHQVMQRGGA